MKYGEFEEIHRQLCEHGRRLSARKGHDYSGIVDTLANLKATGATSAGRVSPKQGVLVRMGDKLCRLWQLMSPGGEAHVRDESIRDTVVDVINYVCLLYALHLEGQEEGGTPTDADFEALPTRLAGTVDETFEAQMAGRE